MLCSRSDRRHKWPHKGEKTALFCTRRTHKNHDEKNETRTNHEVRLNGDFFPRSRRGGLYRDRRFRKSPSAWRESHPEGIKKDTAIPLRGTTLLVALENSLPEKKKKKIESEWGLRPQRHEPWRIFVTEAKPNSPVKTTLYLMQHMRAYT